MGAKVVRSWCAKWWPASMKVNAAGWCVCLPKTQLKPLSWENRPGAYVSKSPWMLNSPLDLQRKCISCSCNPFYVQGKHRFMMKGVHRITSTCGVFGYQLPASLLRLTFLHPSWRMAVIHPVNTFKSFIVLLAWLLICSSSDGLYLKM